MGRLLWTDAAALQRQNVREPVRAAIVEARLISALKLQGDDLFWRFRGTRERPLAESATDGKGSVAALEETA